MSKHSDWNTPDVEARAISTSGKSRHNRFSLRNAAWMLAGAGLAASGFYHYSSQRKTPRSHLFLPETGGNFAPCRNHEDPDPLKTFQQCAIDNLLNTGLPFLENASPITVDDFEERRQRLAQALVAEDVDAFVVEPGYTFKYYGNVSQPEWEVWEVRSTISGHRFTSPSEYVLLTLESMR
jgi:hypothetical protein